MGADRLADVPLGAVAGRSGAGRPGRRAGRRPDLGHGVVVGTGLAQHSPLLPRIGGSRRPVDLPGTPDDATEGPGRAPGSVGSPSDRSAGPDSRTPGRPLPSSRWRRAARAPGWSEELAYLGPGGRAAIVPPDRCPPVSSACGPSRYSRGLVEIGRSALDGAVDRVVTTVAAVVDARISDELAADVGSPTPAPAPGPARRSPPPESARAAGCSEQRLGRLGIGLARRGEGDGLDRPASGGGSCSRRCASGSGPAGPPARVPVGPAADGRPRPPARRTARRAARPRWRRTRRDGT